eukprot:7329963-Prymnesium_polylepis.1
MRADPTDAMSRVLVDRQSKLKKTKTVLCGAVVLLTFGCGAAAGRVNVCLGPQCQWPMAMPRGAGAWLSVRAWAMAHGPLRMGPCPWPRAGGGAQRARAVAGRCAHG